MKKIVIVQDLQLTDTQKDRLKAIGEVTEYTTTPSAQEWLERIQGQDIILSEEPGLQENQYNIHDAFLTFPFTGFLWDVDTDKLKENKLLTAAARGGNKISVAERIITALLNITRKTKEIQNETLIINPADLTNLPSGVYNLPVLVLGKGNIGTEVGKICSALGAKVDYYIRGDNLENKVKNTQVIINCLSEKEDTKGLLSKDILSQISNPFYYVTAMRGTIHDSEVIKELLSNGRMLGYADDCASQPGGDTSNDYFKQASLLPGNTFITPHVAWASKSGIYYSNEVMVENVEKFIAGTPQNLIY